MKELAEKIADALLTNDEGEVAKRLILELKLVDRRSGGVRNRDSIIKIIEKKLNCFNDDNGRIGSIIDIVETTAYWEGDVLWIDSNNGKIGLMGSGKGKLKTTIMVIRNTVKN